MRNEFQELQDIVDTRYMMMNEIKERIAQLAISDEWKKIFVNVCIYRTWFSLNDTQQSQMVNIAEVNSPAVKFLIGEHNKKVGLAKLERISVDLQDEKARVKAMQYILEYGAKKARNYIDLLIAAEKDNKVA